QLSTLLPPIVTDGDPRRCRLRVIGQLQQMVDPLRQFMAGFHQATSRNWSAAFGPAQGPFTPEAPKAHELATRAVAEVGRMMRSGDFGAPERFLDRFTNFLRGVRGSQPAQFAALAAELDGIKVVPDECRAFFERAAEPHAAELKPIIGLLTIA